jgi:hypothetical protein
MTDTKTVAAAHTAAGDALAKAQDVLETLERDRAGAVARQAELTRSREQLALAGLAGGAASDRKALAEVTNESARIHLTIENLGFAITAAREEVSAAQRAVERAAARMNTSAALAEVGEMRAAGSRCATALGDFLTAFDQVIAISNRVRRLGGAWPRHKVFEGSVRRALQTHLYPRHIATEPLLTPAANRIALGVVLDRWISQLEISLDRELKEPVDYGRPPPLPPIEGEQFLENEAAE